jgi:hypothetical protein
VPQDMLVPPCSAVVRLIIMGITSPQCIKFEF